MKRALVLVLFLTLSEVLNPYDNQRTHPDILTKGAAQIDRRGNPTGLLITGAGLEYREVADFMEKEGSSNDLRDGSNEEDGTFSPSPTSAVAPL